MKREFNEAYGSMRLSCGNRVVRKEHLTTLFLYRLIPYLALLVHKDDGRLGGTKQNNLIDFRNIHPFIEDVDGDQIVQGRFIIFILHQTLDGAFSFFLAVGSGEGHGPQSLFVEFG